MESKVFILDQTTIKKLLTIFKLVIPDFQRNFVWKKSKKEQLLDSLSFHWETTIVGLAGHYNL